MAPLVVISHLDVDDVDRADIWLRFESGPARAECVGTFAGLDSECVEICRLVTELPHFATIGPDQFRDFFLERIQSFADSTRAPCAPK